MSRFPLATEAERLAYAEHQERSKAGRFKRLRKAEKARQFRAKAREWFRANAAAKEVPMRGLTDAERSTLERWQRREYVAAKAYGSTAGMFEALDSSALQLVRDGRAEPVRVDFVTVQMQPTATGELALRVDAAARAKGVWP